MFRIITMICQMLAAITSFVLYVYNGFEPDYLTHALLFLILFYQTGRE